MAYRVFVIPINDNGGFTEELNLFLRSHKVLSVDRRLVDQGSASFWSFCVDYLDSSSAVTKGREGSYRNKVDYKEVLTPEEFALFAGLRDLRKQISQEEAVPVYALFTNEQLTH